MGARHSSRAQNSNEDFPPSRLSEQSSQHSGGSRNETRDPSGILSGRKLNGLAPNEPLTEDRAALDFARLYSDRLRYCHTSGSWFEWDGQLWRRDLTGTAAALRT